MTSANLYDDYIQFKNWDVPAGSDPDLFASLLKKSGLGERLAILEIGCGTGGFMDWARQNGHHVEGIELIPELVEAVSKRGFKVYQAPVSDLKANNYDVVISLDVLEHLALDDLLANLRLARTVLKPNGLMIARFPNGASPFAGPWQNGDFTHTKPLSASSLGQVAISTGMVVDSAFNPRSIPAGFLKGIKRRLVYAVRDIIEIAIGFLYFGYRSPMDPNVVVVLKPTPAK
jgi:2-polyprenyl-3-methyl-5-hydroxy-6-metoxy-1,4-benzoquinol methylase